MFFTMTVAIGAALAAAAWSVQAGPTVAVLAAGATGLVSAAVAGLLVVRFDRRARSVALAAGAGLGPGQIVDERPRLPRRRVAGSCPPLRRRRPGRPGAARFASVP